MSYTTRMSLLHCRVINSDQHVILMWSVMFYTLENFQDQVKDTDLTAKALQVSMLISVNNLTEDTPTSRSLLITLK